MKKLLITLILALSFLSGKGQTMIDSLLRIRSNIENVPVYLDQDAYLNNFWDIYNLYVEQGDYAEAWNLVNNTLNVFIERNFENNTYYTRAVLVALVKINNLMENYDLAIRYGEKADTMFTFASDTLSMAYSGLLSSMSSCYRIIGNTIKARNLNRKSFEICKYVYGNNILDDIYLVNKNQLHGFLNNYGLAFMEDNDYRNAEKCFQIIIQSLQNNPSHEVYQIACSNLAIIYSNQNFPKKRAELMERVVPYTQNDYLKIHSYEQIITDYTTLKDTNKVEEYLIRYNITNLNNLFYHFTTFSERERYGRWQRLAYQTLWFNNLTASCIPTISIRRMAFEMNAYYKNFTLNYSNIITDYVKQSKDSNLKELFLRYKNDINNYVFGINTRYSYFNALSKELQMLNNLKDTIKNLLAQKFLYFNEIMDFIKYGEYIIQFCDIDDIAHKNPDRNQSYYTAYVLGKQYPYPIYYYVCRKPQMDTYLHSDISNKTEYYSELYSPKHSEELYQILFEPLEYFLKNTKTIYYAPCGDLSYLNFDLLTDSLGTPLNEKYNLVRVSSVYEIPTIKSRNITTSTTAALFGDIDYATADYSAERGKIFGNLDASRPEIESIANTLKSKNISVKTYTREAATEKVFKSISGNSHEILHLSTHGFSLETERDISERPFAQSVNTYSQKESAMVLSGLALSGANNAWKGNFDLPNVEDGILTAYEISQLDLSNTKLVVLSACETARGKIFPVDGVFGLQRAFKQAGAGSILMSLWKVDDNATAKFMEYFYKFLFETNDRHKALKMAQDEVKKQYPDPYYWAAWVMLD